MIPISEFPLTYWFTAKRHLLARMRQTAGIIRDVFVARTGSLAAHPVECLTLSVPVALPVNARFPSQLCGRLSEIDMIPIQMQYAASLIGQPHVLEHVAHREEN